MRVCSTIFLVIVAGCGSERAAPTEGGVDDGVDGGDDTGMPYSVDDFASFGWSFLGTGTGRSFELDRDCGVTAKKFPPRAEGSGLVAPADCDAFKALVVSPTIVAALRGLPTCPFVTDDVESMGLRLVDGGGVSRGTTGCRDVPPLSSVYAAMSAIDDNYVKYTTLDSGVDVVDVRDADTDGD
jgi:hypothetical protein